MTSKEYLQGPLSCLPWTSECPLGMRRRRSSGWSLGCRWRCKRTSL